MNVLLLALPSALLRPPTLLHQPLIRPACRVVMSEGTDAAVVALKAELADLEASIEELTNSGKAFEMSELNELTAQVDAKTAAIEAITGPPPKRYSAVGRMRQKTEGMGLPDGKPEDGEGGGVGIPDAASVLPGSEGLINIAISLAFVGVVGFVASQFVAPFSS